MCGQRGRGENDCSFESLLGRRSSHRGDETGRANDLFPSELRSPRFAVPIYLFNERRDSSRSQWRGLKKFLSQPSAVSGGVSAPRLRYRRYLHRAHVTQPAFTGKCTEFRRDLRDSDIAISSLFWIARGGDGEPDG